MFWKNKTRRALGLDIGSNSIKAAELSWTKESGVRLLSHQQLKLKAEGILDDEELSQSLSTWMQQNGWKDRETCAGLPQYLAQVQVRDFPAAPDAKLEEMIAYETSQLSGISEEKFIHDYHIMQPKYGRKNPVLIGISRYSVVTDKLRILENAGITPADLTMNSMALVNALFSLHPEAKISEKPHMIIEIGAENSTVVIFGGGQVLSISSLLFGSEKYTKAIMEHQGIDEAKAEEEKLKSEINIKNKKHSLHKITMGLVNELKNAVEQWKLHENAENATLEIEKLWLCGGGTLMGGLPEFLMAHYMECEIELFGPVDKDGKLLPELVTAYGLALQAMGLNEINISLAPSEIRWVSQRKRNLKYLSAAVFFFVIAIAIYMVDFYIKLENEDVVNRKILTKLKACEEFIPRLDKFNEDIHHYEKMIVPFAVNGNNVPRFLSAIREIGNIKGDNFLFVYLADEKSFRNLKMEKAQSKDVQSIFMSNLAAKDPLAYMKRGKVESKCVNDLTENRTLVLIGFTISSSSNKKEHYDLVRQIQTKLSQLPLFGSNTEEVDILSEEERSGREDIMSSPWIAQVVNNREITSQLGGKRFRDFAIKIPFAEENINQANVPEPKKAEKK